MQVVSIGYGSAFNRCSIFSARIERNALREGGSIREETAGVDTQTAVKISFFLASKSLCEIRPWSSIFLAAARRSVGSSRSMTGAMGAAIPCTTAPAGGPPCRTYAMSKPTCYS